MVLRGTYPGIDPQQVLDNMGFEVDVSASRPVDPPTGQELRILREVCDPQRLILG
jgi:glutaconate CoA-transferase subunit B